VFLFEPHQSEQCEFKPQVLLDVTSVWEIKQRAMTSMKAQDHLFEYYTDVGKHRGSQAVRNGGDKAIKYAEAFQRVFPQVTEVLA
jgi:4-oxalomesaconate hydratase